ncbi:MAG: glycoside hydrolase [Actinomycetota bacterium]|nr:glycoside hydrolase [Actinomycetota bacterium]
MRRLLLALLSVAAGGAAVVAALPLLSPPNAASVRPNLFVNPPGPIDANNSPTLVRNPLLETNLVLTNRVDRPDFSALLHSSLDGGATWASSVLPLPAGLDRPFAPDVAFAPDGTLFVSYVNLEGPGNVPANLWVTASKDGGRTFADPVRVAGRLTFQARLAVDDDNTVHLTWLQANEVGLFRLVGGPNPVVATHSTDGGKTFTTPVMVSDPARQRVGAASPVVDSGGDLVVLYQDFKGDRRDFEFLEGPPWGEPFALVVTRSTDGGKTFSPGVEADAGLVPTRRFLVFLPEFPSLAAGRDGNLYLAWADGRNGDEDVFLRRSQDGGRTWDRASRVNDNSPGDRTSQYLPRVAVAPDGRVDVLYLDRRRDPRQNVMTDAYLASSYDEGKNFDSVRVSSSSFDSRVGPLVDSSIGVDFGSRLGLISTRDGAVAAWPDTRLGSEDTGRQDIAAAAVEFAPAPPSAARVRTVLGLLALSLLGLLGWVASSRSSKRHPSHAATSGGATTESRPEPPPPARQPEPGVTEGAPLGAAGATGTGPPASSS